MNAEVETQKESHQFQAEVSELLKLMIHSLYSNKEIFLRELISNASDACDKLRFEALKNDALYESDSELRINVDYDKDARTVTVSDNGIGMSRDDVMNNIGTIAKSGTKEFLKNLTGDQSKDAQLIGQFGVGFYSSFIIADKVTVKTRLAGADKAEGVIWESAGDGNYTLETIEYDRRGTEVILHLREGEDEFLDEWRLRSIIKNYSDHISLPIYMLVEDKDSEGEASVKEERINSATALWTRAKKDIKDEEYQEFYKTVAHDFQDPLAWTHNRVEGKLEYTSLLYIPKQAPFDLWDRDKASGIKLYVQRVFIMDDSDQLMPKYLRFVRGLIDSNDLPLNVSREILQSNKVIDSIRSGSVKKVLSLLENMADKKPEEYKEFWANFGNALKEGLGEDTQNREQIGKLLRFASTHEDSQDQSVSLADYIGRMKEGQDKIYYLTADSYAAAKNSPHLEVFAKKGIEVILMCDRVDEWAMSFMREFEGKTFVSVAKGDLDLGDVDSEEQKQQEKELQESSKDLVERIKAVLEDKVDAVRASTRLTTSPACLVLGEQDMALHMQRLMQQAGHEVPVSKPTLEINIDHALLIKVKDETDDAIFSDWVNILYDQAVLAEGGQLEDPAGFVRKLNTLLLS